MSPAYDPPTADDSYWMEEGCGAFAIALAQRVGAETVIVISNINGQPWSDDLPFEATHVVVEHPTKNLVGDVRGWRTIEAAAKDFDLDLGRHETLNRAPFGLAEFQRLFGDDDGPLYLDDDTVAEASAHITAAATFYAIWERHQDLDLPIRRARRLFHVGDLDPSAKCRCSHEGRALSVSLHPDLWRRIARGQVKGSTHLLEASGATANRLIDAHALTGKAREAVLDWGIRRGLCHLRDAFQVSWYDDEYEQTFQTLHSTRSEAQREAPEGATIKRVQAPEASVELARAHGHREARGNIVEHLIMIEIAAHAPDLSGVWFGDDLDPSRLSAPRGALVPEKLGAWRFTTPPGAEPQQTPLEAPAPPAL